MDLFGNTKNKYYIVRNNYFMPENKNTSRNGLGIGTIIFLIFLTLKLHLRLTIKLNS